MATMAMDSLAEVGSIVFCVLTDTFHTLHPYHLVLETYEEDDWRGVMTSPIVLSSEQTSLIAMD